MAPRKKTAAKTENTAKAQNAKSPAKPAAKKTKRLAAQAHTAAVYAHNSAPRGARNARPHTYADHRSDQYKHYASIMKTVILFLGFVLLLAILANILAPSINERAASLRTGRQFLDTSASGYQAAAPRGNIIRFGNSGAGEGAPSPAAPFSPGADNASAAGQAGIGGR